MGVAGAEDLFRPGRVLMFGEIHGTQEVPATIAELLVQGLDAGYEVELGLEIPRAEEPLLRAYLQSDGSLPAGRLYPAWFVRGDFAVEGGSTEPAKSTKGGGK